MQADPPSSIGVRPRIFTQESRIKEPVLSQSRIRSAISSLKRAIGGLAVFSFVINILMLTGPMFMLQLYDRVLGSGSVPTLVAFSGLAAGLYMFLGLLEFIRSRILVRVGRRLNENLGDTTFDSSVYLSLKLGRTGASADPMRDLDRVTQFVSTPGLTSIFDMPWIPVYVGLIYAFHPWLGYLAAAGAVFLVILAILNQHLTAKPLEQSLGMAARRSRMVEAGRRNSEVLSAMSMLPNVRRLWNDKSGDYMDLQGKAADWIALFGAITKTSRFVLQSAMLGLGAYLVLLQEISAGVMIAGSIILTRALAPVEQATAHWRGFAAAWDSLKRLNNVLNAMPDPAELTSLPMPEKDLRVTNLFVAPPGQQKLILQGVTFGLQAGEGLGVIGPSASGKSTLARALVGVWPIVRGDVRLDGAELTQWSPDTFGDFVGYLPQDVELFDGTVAQNIARLSADPDEAEIIKAAKLAGVHDLILALEHGYDTEIGEGGQALSAGQRQRIGLARALFGEPFFVVLDEPNSNLDAEGEAALSAAIKAMRERGSIVIIVAHRPSAIASVDKLLMLRNGRQEAFGPKADVLAQITQQKPSAGGLKVVKD